MTTQTQQEPMPRIPFAHCAVPPHSAFDLGWIYGPITHEQDRTSHRYANACKRDVNGVPGYWLMPPAWVR